MTSPIIIFMTVLALLFGRTEGFAPPTGSHSTLIQKTSVHAHINNSIDLDSPKVATQEKLSDGDKKVYCRCWQSGTFPLCDGSHMAHNKDTGDNVGPLILSAAKSVDASTEVVVDNSGVESTTDGEKKSILDKLKSVFKKKEKNDDGLTTKERLAKMGLSALLSYGWVSNMSYAVTLSLSWYGFSKKVREYCYMVYIYIVSYNVDSLLSSLSMFLCTYAMNLNEIRLD